MKDVRNNDTLVARGNIYYRQHNDNNENNHY
jgi:hypothetical protein